MGRHSSDPIGFARLLLVGLAILVLLALLALGGVSLVGSLNSDAVPSPTAAVAESGPDVTAPPASPSPAGPISSPGSEVPTVLVECQADLCPLFVRITGGDIVEDRDLRRGQQAAYFQRALDVVLGDASTVYVEVNGVARPPGKPGERLTMKVKRDVSS
ncbi:hypothetical protein Sme01_65310 [Sphaerisporangium melleum]|uniref:DUF4115 domain-containing protein n=1 Tax=Sphaerisporangium melleum TaxID=321316 RepID=A0A917VP43_9ACTN|nr:hypothetical protein [Sphaerisporangium melleum]GGL03487.1 hypothetical protein GCM10007964_51990 [Sphaerisporangium melleum]GII74055.1 hypothetical protein Sme01_65310 [Sphaerisporangium melleum]